MQARGSRAALLAAALLLAACSPKEAPKPAAAAPAPLPSEVVVLPTLPAYICPTGRVVEVQEDKTTGVVTLADGSTEMTAFKAVDGSRSRFVSGEVTITLSDTQMLLEGGRTRRMVCPRRPSAPEPGVVWGRLDKRDRMALASGTRAKVMILDVSRADAPAVELGSTTIETNGNQVPLAFLVRYDPKRIDPRMTYAIAARVEGPGGQLLYVTDTHNPLFGSGLAQPAVDLLLVPARP